MGPMLAVYSERREVNWKAARITEPRKPKSKAESNSSMCVNSVYRIIIVLAESDEYVTVQH
jgi:hypothetical protein